jgi:predicted metal-binding membrane protein
MHAHPSAGGAVLIWTAMMSVMMAPTVAPWIAAYFRFGVADLARLGRAAATTLFAAGYLTTWVGFSVAVVTIHTLVPHPERFRALALVGAGLFQLSPLKQACLKHCRNPLTFLLTRRTSLVRRGYYLGLVHGSYCLGCCWALMLTAVAVGMMNVWWMAALAAITFLEQVSRWGERLRIPLGIALLAGGALLKG